MQLTSAFQRQQTPSSLVLGAVLLGAITLSAGGSVVSGGLRAQACIAIGDGNATTGPSGLRPFGKVRTDDAVHAAQTMLIYVPKALFGNKRQRIRSIAFAPSASRTRVFTEIFVGLRQSDKGPTELDPVFSRNSNGFGAGKGFKEIRIPASAGKWWHLPIDYPVNPARNLTITIRVRGAGSTGMASDAGFRQDPNLYSVHAPTWAAPRGTVGRGGPKMLLCVDAGYLHTFDDSACVGSNRKAPRLDLSGGHALGQSFGIALRDAPASPSIAVLAISLRGYSGGADLRRGGAPGCTLRCSRLDFLLPVPTTAGRGRVLLPIPNDLRAIGALLAMQYFPYDPGANGLQLTSSNWGLLQIGN